MSICISCIPKGLCLPSFPWGLLLLERPPSFCVGLWRETNLAIIQEDVPLQNSRMCHLKISDYQSQSKTNQKGRPMKSVPWCASLQGLEPHCLVISH